MTGPFDDGVRLGDAPMSGEALPTRARVCQCDDDECGGTCAGSMPMSVEQRAAGDPKIAHLLAFADYMVQRPRWTELCRARWGEIGSLFRCRCKRDRLVPHVCECICRPRRP